MDKLKTIKPCLRCAVLEDLLETATSERDKARDESAKADEETLSLKVRDIQVLGKEMTDAYGVIKAFERRAKAAESVAKWPEHLLSLLQRSREYVADSLEAHEHSDGRELLADIDEALMPDGRYCFTKTEQQHD